MFDGLFSTRQGGDSSAFLDAFEGFTGQTQRFSGVGEAVEPVEVSAFGAIASYQVCACCARFHSATTPADGGDGPSFFLNADDRGELGPNGKPSLSSTDAGSQITRSNQSWATALGTAATVTYAFRDSVTTMPTDTAGFSQFSATQIAATILALAAWSDVANITFQRVQNVGSEYSNNATILLGNYSSGQEGAAAFAYLPGGMPGATGSEQVQGDVWINSSLSYNTLPVQLGYGQHTLLHELGHAIGLSHPAAYNASADGVVTYEASAIYYEDSRQYTVMSYFSEQVTGADFRADPLSPQRYASAPLLDDISAAQRLYGSNMTTRTGDTVYGFNSTAGRAWFSAISSSSALVFCAWDAGGTDTFDFSGYFNNGQIIDLRQGAFSSVGGMSGNVSIAIGAVIENAIGGSGSDTFRGNSANNRFTPNAGTDVVDGGLGTDTVVFSGARAAYTITWNGQVGTVVGNGQNVTVTNVESLQFTDQTVAAAPTGGLIVGGDITNETITGTALADVIGGLGGVDTINGLGGNDNLNGGSGNDALNGGDGDDILIGALGDDAMNGGAGVDTADYAGAGAGVTVNLAAGTASGGAGSDTLSLVENVTGSALADTLTGDGNANTLRGGGGIDTLNGGAGGDLLVAGAPGEGGGAPDVVKAQGTANGSIGSAVSLTGAFDLLTNPAIADSSTIPHATVVATTHGGVEYYAITVVAGETVTFDIDGASFDSTLRLMTGGGVELANNDDNASSGEASTNSALTHTFSAAGTYYIQVAKWQTNTADSFTSTAPPAGQTYTLHVSSPSQTPVPIQMIGSTLNGDAGGDTLEGGSGADTLNGGADDDSLTGGGGADAIDGGDGTDTAVYSGNRSAYTISVSGGVTTVTGPDGTDTVSNVERLQFADGLYNAAGDPLTTAPINGTVNADSLEGTASGDTINGLDGDDVITGGGGNDTIDGGTGSDTAVFSGTLAGSTVSTVGGVTTVTGPDGSDSLTNVEYLRFSNGTLIVGAGGGQYFEGTAGGETINGTAFNDQMYGLDGNDNLNGGAGADLMSGGRGDDAFYVDHAADQVLESAGEGSDRILASVSYNLAAGVAVETLETVSSSATTAINLRGNELTNTVVGNNGVNQMWGGAGNDFLYGLDGNDVLFGEAGIDVLNGGAGNDSLNGGVGADLASGGLGDDTYYVDDVADKVFESTGAGADRILASVSYNLAAGVAVETLETVSSSATTAINLRGNELTNTVVGNNGVNQMWGGAGNDFLYGLDGNDVLFGEAGIDVLNGGAGNDSLNGGVGADLASGGLGDDTYYVDDVADKVFESTGAGSDRVVASTSYNLAAGVAVETLETVSSSATTAINLRGNELTNTVVGNNGVNQMWGGAGNDFLYGLDGNDVLFGEAGIDVLNGGAGNDSLNGGVGADLASGGLGDDTYYVDDVADKVFESTGAGSDRVLASASYNLAAGVAVETLETVSSSATTAINLRANELANTVVGNNGVNQMWGGAGNDFLYGLDGNDVLFGEAGIDVLNGGAGNDSLNGGVGADLMGGGLGDDAYYVDDAADQVSEAAGAGSDRVLASVSYNLAAGVSVETLETVSSSATTAINLRANELANTVVGNNGVNQMWGGAGNDSLYGLDGNDVLFGEAGVDVLNGGAGDDSLTGGADNDVMSGGLGDDTAVFSGLRSGYSISTVGGVTTVSGADGTDTLTTIERLQFSDGLYDISGNPLPPAAPQQEPVDALAAKGDALLVLPQAGAADEFVLKSGEGLEPLVLPSQETGATFPVDSSGLSGAMIDDVDPLVLPGVGGEPATSTAFMDLLTQRLDDHRHLTHFENGLTGFGEDYLWLDRPDVFL